MGLEVVIIMYLFDTYIHVAVVSDLVTVLLGMYKLAKWWISTMDVRSDRLLIPQAVMTSLKCR